MDHVELFTYLACNGLFFSQTRGQLSGSIKKMAMQEEMNYLSYGISRHDGFVLYGNGYMVGKEEEEK